MALQHKLLHFIRGGASALTLAGLLGAASAFLYWLIVAHTSTSVVLGRSATIVLAGSLVNAVTSFGLTVGLLRQNALEQANRRSVALAVILSVLGSAAISIAVGLAWPTHWLHEANVSRTWMLVLLLEISAGLAVSTLIDTVAVGYGAPKIALWRNGAVLLLRLALALGAASLMHGTTAITQVFIAPIVLTVLLALPWFLAATRTTVPWRHGPGAEREMIATSLRSWPASLVFNAVTLGVPLTVSFIAGPSAGAVFYLLWNVGTLANSFVAALTSLGLGEQRRYRRKEIYRRTAVVGLAAALGGEVALFAFGSNYLRAGWIASLVLGVALVPYGYLQFRVMRLRRAGRHNRATVGTMAMLAVAEIPLALWRPQDLWVVATIWLGAAIAGSLATS